MRTLARLALITLVAMFLLALSPAADAQAPQRGGTLIHGIDSNPETLLPALSTGGVTWATGCKIFNGLVYLDKQVRPQPELADSWTVSKDRKQITFNPKIDYRKLFPYDPARANRLLDEAGVRRGAGGARFPISMVYQSAFTALEPIAQILRSNWRDIGVDLQLQPVERQLMIEKVFTNPDFGVTSIPCTTGGDPAIGVVRAYITAGKPVRPFTNPTGYSNKEVDGLAAQGQATLEVSERAKFYHEFQEIVARDLPVLNLVDRPEVDVASKKVHGLWQRAVPYDGWEYFWMSK